MLGAARTVWIADGVPVDVNNRARAEQLLEVAVCLMQRRFLVRKSEDDDRPPVQHYCSGCWQVINEFFAVGKVPLEVVLHLRGGPESLWRRYRHPGDWHRRVNPAIVS